jgi:hypothetical protein
MTGSHKRPGDASGGINPARVRVLAKALGSTLAYATKDMAVLLPVWALESRCSVTPARSAAALAAALDDALDALDEWIDSIASSAWVVLVTCELDATRVGVAGMGWGYDHERPLCRALAVGEVARWLLGADHALAQLADQLADALDDEPAGADDLDDLTHAVIHQLFAVGPGLPSSVAAVLRYLFSE